MPTFLDQQNYLQVNTSVIENHFPKHCRFDKTNIKVSRVYVFSIRIDVHIYDKHRCQYWNHYTDSTFVHILVGINEIIYSINWFPSGTLQMACRWL